ncbi:alpha/beta hydrolase [Nocardioides jiangxiensis]|uniref:Alpha/beta hydrolase n=1 Tax=Nocardioides jiangxiensis TaxID=3064524 RepID=A0ABT9AXQ6_9ACTN|nr:alpha/beta hydrolase [Nocardioides sp. WY-20]MDO7866820.1 alpha/beta hydrolase [Nocardioides sp. WY-20]
MRTDFGGGSLQSQVLGLVLRHSARRIIDAWAWAPSLPWPYGVVDQLGQLQRKVPGTRFEESRIGPIRARVVRHGSARPGRHVLYFHGGAFLVGGWHLHGGLLSRIAAATGATVTSVEYRQFPRHSVTQSTADGLAAYRHLLAQGVSPEEIVFMGDSAGGFLIFTVADAAREAGLPMPRALVGMSPLIDFDFIRTPVGRTRRGDHVFGPRALRTFGRVVGGAPGAVRTPVDCDLATLPPVLLQVSSSEALYRQVARFAQLLEEAGVPTDLHVWPGQVHVFQAASVVPEAVEAVGALAAWADRAWSAVRGEAAASA